jgi:integrase
LLISAVAANRPRSSLSAAFAWALRAGPVDHNPMIGTVKGEESSRERVLAPDELRAIWAATSPLAPHDRIVRLLLLTGARRQEVGGMAEAELDRARGLWLLPGERSKNGRQLEVPLSRQALALLPEPDGRSYLFGRGGRAPFSGWSRCKARLDQQIAAQGQALAAWRLHDLRRSFVTLISEHGLAPPHIVEAIVGHVSGHKGGVAGVYNRALYRQEKAAALQAWAGWLVTVVEGRAPAGNVVALRG